MCAVISIRAQIIIHIIPRLINVCRAAGNNIVLRVYLIESLPMKRRGTGLAIIDMFWMVGYLLALGNHKWSYKVLHQSFI